MFGLVTAGSALRRSDADDKEEMLAVERLSAFEPANRSCMLALLKHARAGGVAATEAWIGGILRRSM